MKILYWLFIGWWAWPLVLIWKLIFGRKPSSDKTPTPTATVADTPKNEVAVTPVVEEYIPKQSKVYTLSIPAAGKEALEAVAAATRFESWELGKSIWTNFYKIAFDKMTDVKALENSGIYKITNLTTGMVYIGQSVNVKQRWREHIRIGCGADFPSSSNQMYKDMYIQGPENFSYQIIDYCSGKKFLNEREKFWITHYDSCTNGYNKTRGNQ